MARTRRSARKSTGRYPHGPLGRKTEAEAEPEVQAEEEEEPMERMPSWKFSWGERGGRYPRLLRRMLRVLGINHSPRYHTKIVPRPGRDEWTAKVDVYLGHEHHSTHTAPTLRSTRREAESDAAWEALTAYTLEYQRDLVGTPYEYYPTRQRGTGDFKIKTVEAALPKKQARHCMYLLADRCVRYRTLQKENKALREQLKKMEATHRAYVKQAEGEEGEFHPSEDATWTVHSPRYVSDGEESVGNTSPRSRRSPSPPSHGNGFLSSSSSSSN